MIVKMIILRLLGSSDDKEEEKIGVARPKGPPLRAYNQKFSHLYQAQPEKQKQ